MAFENTGALAFANALSKLGANIGQGMQERYKRDAMAAAVPDMQAGNWGSAGAKLMEIDPATGFKLLEKQRATDDFKQAYGGGSLSALGAPTQPAGPMNLAGGMPDPNEVSGYISQAAAARGIDPNVALRVANSEGLRSYVGDDNSSFGPYQLHYGGVAKGGNAVPGLGDEFTKSTGLDARDPQTWRQQVDFSLDRAKQGGWGPWHGWKGDPMAGIGQPQPTQVAQAGNTMSDASPSLTAQFNRARWIIANPNMSDAAKEAAKLDLQNIQTMMREDRAANRPTEAQRNYNLARQQGFTGSFMDYQQSNRASTTVNVGAGENEFMKKSNAKMADKFAAIIDDGDAAQQDLALVSRLGELGQVVNTGGGAALQNFLSQYGIKVGDNIGQVEAYQAIVDKLTPSQRVPGSGNPTDRENTMFKSSLPSLVRTPEGNKIIRDTLTGMANAKIARAQIAEQVMTGQMTPQQGIAEMRKLPSPFKEGGAQEPPQPAFIPEPPQGVTAEQINQQAAARIANNPADREKVVRQMMLWKKRIPGLAIP